jgi:hypothetical protein
MRTKRGVEDENEKGAQNIRTHASLFSRSSSSDALFKGAPVLRTCVESYHFRTNNWF